MVIEIVTFRLASGVDDATFIAADERVQKEFFYMQRGLVRRTTARGLGGEWLVLTFWDSVADAESAAGAVPEDFTALIDRSTYRTTRYTTLD